MCNLYAATAMGGASLAKLVGQNVLLADWVLSRKHGKGRSFNVGNP